jgi:flagellar motility protein MotE (MotC chaperone)
MNSNVFSIMIVICVVFLVIFAGVYSVYVYKPELLGIAPPIDSISIVNAAKQPTISPAEIELKAVKHQRDSLAKQLMRVTDSLSKVQTVNETVKRDIEEAKRRYAEQDKQMTQHLDSLVKANYTVFAQIYDKAGAKEVAKILSELDERDAAFILKSMKPKNAAKVLDEMNPIQAAAIMVLGANQPVK